MKAILAIARLSVVRLLRERANLFFVFAFPMLLILLIGLSFGGGTRTTIAVVGPASSELVDQVVAAFDEDPALGAAHVASRDLALDALSRGRVSGVVVVPAWSGSTDEGTASLAVEFALRDEEQGARPAVEAALAAVLAPHRVAALARQLGVSPESSTSLSSEEVASTVEVRTRTIGDELDAEFASLGQFDFGASTQLVLFIFITTLGGAARIVESRQLGVTGRMLSGPVSATEVVAGEGLGRFLVALFQAAWVIVGGLLLFSVDWGDPLAALAVVAAFALAAAGAGLLLGATARNVNQASGLGTLFGLTLAALGGSMAPLDIFSPGLRRVAHVTPHAWANDAFAELTRRNGGLVDVLPQIGVLLAFAVVLGGLAGWRLRIQMAGR